MIRSLPLAVLKPPGARFSARTSVSSEVWNYMLGLMRMMAEQKQHAEILDGRELAEQIKKEVAEEVGRIRELSGVQPRLAGVLVGDDAASAVYVRNKGRAFAETGLLSEQHQP